MKKTFIYVFTVAALFTVNGIKSYAADNPPAPQPVIMLEIPTDEFDKIEIKKDNDNDIKIKEVLKETGDNIKTGSQNAASATKSAASTASVNAKKAAENAKKATGVAAKKTKEAAKTTAETTKTVADKTTKATKKAAKKTVGETRDFIDNVAPKKPLTQDSLVATAAVNKLKDERKEIKSAYDSRIKDVDAKIKATEKNSALDDVQKRNLIYELNKEKNKLQTEQLNYMNSYDKKIEQARENKRK